MQDLVGRNVGKGLLNPAGPLNFQTADAFGAAESEMNAAVAGGKIAAGGTDEGVLFLTGIRHDVKAAPMPSRLLTVP